MPSQPFDLPLMTADLRRLVECESPSDDLSAVARCADLVALLGRQRMGAEPERIITGDRPHLLWRWGTGTVDQIVLGHLDTVWPVGVLDRWPFTVDEDRGIATGPGCFDMKAGLVQAFHAIAALEGDERDGIAVLITSDEEIGSPHSRDLIEATATGARAAYVPEPSAHGALKAERKGVSLYDVTVRGRAAHAGLEPERGISATVELAHQVLALAQLGDVDAGTTVTPTVARAGTTSNTVAATATVRVDVRCRTLAEQDRVDAAIHGLAPVLDGATLHVEGGPNRPPLERAGSAALVAAAQRMYARLGLGTLDAVAVGGASDGNFTAGLGVPTVDGIGPVGDGAHAEGEWVSLPDLPGRAALLAALLREQGLVRPDDSAT